MPNSILHCTPGAGVIVIERLDHARRRNAPTIYAELAGYGSSCDAYHITSPEPSGAGLSHCIRMALDSANCAATDVGYVNAHGEHVYCAANCSTDSSFVGTSTPYNDKFETVALKSVFGDHATTDLKISSTKGATGHTLGAAGGIEAVATVLALHTGVLPPTINLDNPDPDCDLDYVANRALYKDDFKCAISENLGFGGHNGALVFSRFSTH